MKKKICGCLYALTPILYLLAAMPLWFTSCESVQENYLLGKWQVVEATTNKYEDGKSMLLTDPHGQSFVMKKY